jgi:two-component SAPR family response regulator
MRFRLLGALEVEANDGTVVAIAAPKRRALLAALLIDAGRPVSADRLADALWGSEQPPAAIASLHAHISRLRGEIGADRLLTLPAGYLVRVEDKELDAQRSRSVWPTAGARRLPVAGRRRRRLSAPPWSCGAATRWPSSRATTSPRPRSPAWRSSGWPVLRT